MTGLLGLTLPSWAGLIGYGVAAIAIASGGAYVDHRLMEGAVAKAQTQTASVQSEYSDYKARVAGDEAKANADYAAKLSALQGSLKALQDKLAQQASDDAAKSLKLKELLNNAAPQDVRPIGPVALSYYRQLSALGENH